MNIAYKANNIMTIIGGGQGQPKQVDYFYNTIE